MPDRNAAEKLLFNYETTNLTDYRQPELGPPVPSPREKPRYLATRPRPLKDVHTLSDWKATAIPFDLLHTQKPIVRSNPWTTQKKYGKPIVNEEEHAYVVKTRPRLVMTPAVSMDDIEDVQTRKLLCHDMYTTDATRSQREAVADYVNVCAPFPKHPAPSNPITLPKLKEPVVSPEWRMETVSWDNKQMRAKCDPTKEFWLRFKQFEYNKLEVRRDFASTMYVVKLLRGLEHHPELLGHFQLSVPDRYVWRRRRPLLLAVPRARINLCRACDEFAVVTSHRRKLRQQRTN